MTGARRERVDVLGVGVDRVSVEELQGEVLALSRTRDTALVLNANVHCINLSYRYTWLREMLDGAAVVFCDGAGVVLGARVLGRPALCRITYADWMWRLAGFAASEGLSLFFLGGRPGVAERAAGRLRERYPALEISGVQHGHVDLAPGSPENEELLERVNAASPDVLVVGLGMPLQEWWLRENRTRLRAGVALTGGAVFDYLSGDLRRGPRVLTDHGFEWLARLLVEPRRLWRRYLLGNPLFLARVLGQRLSESWGRSGHPTQGR